MSRVNLTPRPQFGKVTAFPGNFGPAGTPVTVPGIMSVAGALLCVIGVPGAPAQKPGTGAG